MFVFIFFYFFFFFYLSVLYFFFFFFSSRRRHTRCYRDWSQTCALPISRRSTTRVRRASAVVGRGAETAGAPAGRRSARVSGEWARSASVARTLRPLHGRVSGCTTRASPSRHGEASAPVDHARRRSGTSARSRASRR